MKTTEDTASVVDDEVETVQRLSRLHGHGSLIERALPEELRHHVDHKWRLAHLAQMIEDMIWCRDQFHWKNSVFINRTELAALLHFDDPQSSSMTRFLRVVGIEPVRGRRGVYHRGDVIERLDRYQGFVRRPTDGAEGDVDEFEAWERRNAA